MHNRKSSNMIDAAGKHKIHGKRRFVTGREILIDRLFAMEEGGYGIWLFQEEENNP